VIRWWIVNLTALGLTPPSAPCPLRGAGTSYGDGCG
jgi:hypothetical protein